MQLGSRGDVERNGPLFLAQVAPTQSVAELMGAPNPAFETAPASAPFVKGQPEASPAEQPQPAAMRVPLEAPAPGAAVVPEEALGCGGVEEGAEDTGERQVHLVAKWNKQEIDLCVDESLTVFDLKRVLESETTVPPERQRVVGLKAAQGKVSDERFLRELVLKLPVHKFILMGTPQDQLLVEPEHRPEVFDDEGDGAAAAKRYSAWEWQRRSRGEVDGLGEATGRPWRVVFQDTFDADGRPDPAKWEHQTDCNAWVNNAVHKELQHYTDGTADNATVAGGELRIAARRESAGGQSYSSARLTTRSAANGRWRYGRRAGKG